MKKILLLFAALLFVCPIIKAQDEAESIIENDIEIEGLESVWIQVSLNKTTDGATIDARPHKGATALLTKARKKSVKLLKALFKKYPETMLSRLGDRIVTEIEFEVQTDGRVALRSIEGGASLGIDAQIAKQILDDKLLWTPARVGDEPVAQMRKLTIDIML